jgi:hypothetical protein
LRLFQDSNAPRRRALVLAQGPICSDFQAMKIAVSAPKRSRAVRSSREAARMGAANGAHGAVEQQGPRRARLVGPYRGPRHRTAADAATRERTLLDDPDTLAHVLLLAELRDSCFARPHWPGAIPRYWSAVEQSPLRKQLAWSELDDLVLMSFTGPAPGARERVVRGRR